MVRWPVLAGAFVLLAGCATIGSRLRKADTYMEEGRNAAAVRIYEEVLEKRPSEPRALLGVARAWIASGEPERAIAPAQVAVEAGVPGGQRVLARALLAVGRGADARKPAAAALEETPDDPQAELLLAEAHLAAAELGPATDLAERAMQHAGGPPALSLAAWVYLRTGNEDRARTLAVRAAGRALDDAAVQAEAAAVLRTLADAAEAEGAARTARTLLSATGQDWEHEAARRVKGGDIEGAARLLARLRAIYPEDGEHAWQLGQVWLARGAPALAAAELAAALELAPYSEGGGGSGVMVADRASDRLTAEQRKAARAQIGRTLSEARSRLGDLTGAAAAMQIAMEATAEPATSDLLALAVLWEKASQPDRALLVIQQALDRDQNNPNAHRRAAHLLAARGEVGAAIGHGRLAWDLDPGKAEDALLLATLYRSRGEEREARRLLGAAIQRNPGDARLREALGGGAGYTGK